MNKTSFYKRTLLIRENIHKNEFSNELIIQIINLIKQSEIYLRYFFSKEPGSNWFLLLYTNDILTKPPEPIETPNGSRIINKWIAGNYLIEQAKLFPDEICEIINKIKTNNFFVVENLIDSALKIPFDRFLSIKENILNLLNSSSDNMFIPLSYEKVITHFIDKGNYSDALEFCKSLYAPVLPEIKDSEFPTLTTRIHSRFDNDHWVFEVWEKTNSKLSKNIPDQYLALHQELLGKITEILFNQLKDQGKSDYGLSRWRSSIEDSDQNLDKYDIRDLYIDSIISCLEVLCESNHDVANDILKRYISDSLGIFQRIAFSILTKHGNNFIKLVDSVIGNKDNWENSETYHEFFLLYTNQFGIIDKSTQESFIKYFIHEDYLTRDNEREDYKIIRYLSPISKYLGEKENTILENLQKKYENPERPEFLSWHTSAGFVQPISPLTIEEFKIKNLKQQLNYLNDFKPERKDFFTDEIQGLGELFESSILEDKDQYINGINTIISSGLSNFYSRFVLSAFSEMSKKNEIIIDDNSLRLINYYVFEKYKTRLEGDVDIFIIYKRVADLLIDIFTNDNTINIADEQNQIISTIKNLLSLSERENEQEGDFDPITSSLNTLCGKSIKALLEYLRLMNRRERKNIGETDYKPSIPDKIKNVLDENLITKYKHPGLRSVFGQYLPTLYYYDKNWSKNNFNNIFSKIEPKKYSDGWLGYILSNKLYSDLFHEIKSFYEQELKTCEKTYDFKFYGSSAEERLTEHILVAYLNNLIELDDSLIHLMFSNLPDNKLEHIGFWFYKSLNEIRPKSENKKWIRILTLWDQRVNHFSRTEIQKRNNLEIVSYLRMLTNIPPDVDPSNLEDILTTSIDSMVSDEVSFPSTLIIEYCEKISKNNPGVSVRLVEKLVNTVKPIRIMGNKDFENIFINANETRDQEIIKSSDRIINILGSQGDFRWERYLSPGFFS